MKRFALALTAALLALPAVAAEKLRIAAVSAPLASFAQTLGGSDVEVFYPVPEGADAAFWRPSIQQIGEIQAADIILLNGADFADWTKKTSLPRSRTVVTSAGFADQYIETEEGVTHSHGAEGAHSHTGLAPNTWMDFALAAQQAEAVAQAVIRRNPDLESAVSGRLETLTSALVDLDARARSIGEALGGAPVIGSHPGYEYFARAYGLNLRHVTWPQGEAPDAAAIQALDDLLAAHPATLLLWQGSPHPEAQAAADERGLTSVILPTASSAPADFVQLMSEGLDALAGQIN